MKMSSYAAEKDPFGMPILAQCRKGCMTNGAFLDTRESIQQDFPHSQRCESS